MSAPDQSAAIRFLRRPQTHGSDKPVETIETHISVIFLVGDRAFKLKRAVELPYVDFSTPDKRRQACEKEVSLNGRTAPNLYLGVRHVTCEQDGGLALDGAGERVDTVVEMVRFEQANLFDRMATDGRLTRPLMDEVARMIARFHHQAPVVHAGSGSANMRAVLDINEAGFATSRVFGAQEVDDLNRRFRKALSDHARRLDAREAVGAVRRGHGDLHLRNICLFEDRPQLFDCIEFNEQIAVVDVLYDFAFLLMDLWHRSLPDFANLVMNRYLDAADDEDGFVLLPFFMAVRAAVRAHVTATQVEEDGGGQELADTARSYFTLALELLEPSPPRLVAIGGFSGTGKSTVAEALASGLGPPPGARVLESDRLRKAMFGVAPDTRLDAGAYRPGVSDKVYRDLCESAGAIVSAGGGAVVDAVFDKPDKRGMIERAAHDASVSFTGLWLDVDAATLRRRLERRKGGPSDATVDVLEKQLGDETGPIEWRRVDAGRDPEKVTAAALEAVRNLATAR